MVQSHRRILMNKTGFRVDKLVAKEAQQHPSILVVEASERTDAIDLLFVVRGDLWQGEDAAFSILGDLYARFPDRKFDFMVLPEERYGSDFKWGESSQLIYRQ